MPKAACILAPPGEDRDDSAAICAPLHRIANTAPRALPPIARDLAIARLDATPTIEPVLELLQQATIHAATMTREAPAPAPAATPTKLGFRSRGAGYRGEHPTP